MILKMSEIEKTILRLLQQNPGLSDGELADLIKGRRESLQYINQSCREMAGRGIILRQKRPDGIIGNWLIEKDKMNSPLEPSQTAFENDEFSNKKIKQILEVYLASQGWSTEIAWGFTHGVDIEARQGLKRWVIEVKSLDTAHPLPVNSFVSALGEVLQRMDEADCKYSVAFPDLEQFRRLWERLPALAKSRNGITALFVSPAGNVIESI
jgi:hypothetical protein